MARQEATEKGRVKRYPGDHVKKSFITLRKMESCHMSELIFIFLRRPTVVGVKIS